MIEKLLPEGHEESLCSLTKVILNGAVQRPLGDSEPSGEFLDPPVVKWSALDHLDHASYVVWGPSRGTPRPAQSGRMKPPPVPRLQSLLEVLSRAIAFDGDEPQRRTGYGKSKELGRVRLITENHEGKRRWPGRYAYFVERPIALDIDSLGKQRTDAPNEEFIGLYKAD